MRVPLPLIGPSNKARSLPVSAQVTLNVYPEVNPEGKNVVSLHAFPGLREVIDIAATTARTEGVGRGLHVFNGNLYAVMGDRLYLVAPDGVGGYGAISEGEVPGNQRVDMANNGTGIAIATGAEMRWFDPPNPPLQVTDADVLSPSTVTYLNSQFLFDNDGAEFGTSQLTGPISITDFADPSDVAQAEAYPDSILRVVSFNQMAYFFGSDSMEPWYASGVGSPPWARVNSGIRRVGLAGRWAIAVDDDAIFFLDNTRTPRMMRGFEPLSISNPPLGKEFQEYETVSDAVAMVYTIDAQRFFQLNFPTANRSWVFHEPSASWFQLSSGIDVQMHASAAYAYCYGKHLMLHPSNGKLYELDFDTYTDAGQAVSRKRTTANIHGGLYGAPGEEIIFERVIFDVETGVGINTGQGSDPQLMVRYSDDGGRTWSAGEWCPLGDGGKYLTRVELTNQGRAYNRVYELSYSEPTRFSLIGASADIEIAA